MLASLEDAPLEDPQLVYEPKYDGIRAIAEVSPGGPIRLWSRLGNEKTSQFPEVVAALGKWARRQKQPAVLDGEIVALDADGRPAGFQQLQGRIHLSEAPSAASAPSAPSASSTPLDFVCEDDVRVALASGRTLVISERAIVTPSARDLGEQHRVFTIAPWRG